MSVLNDGEVALERSKNRAARAIFISQHRYNSKRKAGFHWLAQAYRKAGWEVLFVTVGVSWLSYLKGTYTKKARRSPSNCLIEMEDGVLSYVWQPLFHPINMGISILNAASARLFKWYGSQSMKYIEDQAKSAEQIIFESSPAILLLERLRKTNPRANFVYRVSDDIGVIGAHPVLAEEEQRLAPHFDLISIPSPLLACKFTHCKNVRVLRHGVDLDMLIGKFADPYPNDGRVRVLSIGQTLFDYDAATMAAEMFPEWRFYFFGDLGSLKKMPNVYNYGEVSFDELKPYLVHAHIGAAFYRMSVGTEYLIDTSNKIAQYALARLPIVCPLQSASGRTDLFSYRMGEGASLKEALLGAWQSDRSRLKSVRPMNWDQVAREIMIGASKDRRKVRGLP